MKSVMKTREPSLGDWEPRPPHAEQRKYATVSLSIPPNELPPFFMRRVLAICAAKVGSSDVDLASHLMITLNVSFRRRAGRLSSDVLIIKDPEVYRSSVRDVGVSAKE